MTLDVDIKLTRGAFTLHAAFSAPEGLTALFGRSGSGKTTLVNVIAGLIRPDRGRITVNGVTFVDAAKGVFIPPHRRGAGYVFQEDRLFPHMTVRANLLYGAWFSRRRLATGEFARLTESLGIEHLTARTVANLSGGERQRVAIGRALLTKPRLLLMDEPFASLDAARKQELTPLIERLRDEARIPIVYVSHAIAEVARLATTVAVLDAGRIAACGPVSAIFAQHDLDLFEPAALIDATVVSHDDPYGLTVLRSNAGLWRIPRTNAPLGSTVRLRVGARDVVLFRGAPSGTSALNLFSGTVLAIDGDGLGRARVSLDCSGDILIAQITRYSAAQLSLAPGHTVHALIKTTAFEP